MQVSGLRDLFWTCILHCETIDVFEGCWKRLLEEGQLHGNKWLSSIYDIRHKWSTAFNREIFDLNMSSTQRSECANSVLKPWSSSLHTLKQCIVNVDRLSESWRINETDEDFRCINGIPLNPRNCIPMLDQASKFYSITIFRKFEFEYNVMAGGLGVSFSGLIGEQMFSAELFSATSPNICFKVSLDLQSLDIVCSCHKWESMNILCCHALRVLTMNNIFLIPERYLSQRWSKTANEGSYSFYGCSNGIVGKDDCTFRRNQIMNYAIKIVNKFKHSEKGTFVLQLFFNLSFCL